MSLETEELNSAFNQAEEKENEDSYQNKTTRGSSQIMLPLNPVFLSTAILPDEEEATEESGLVSTCVGQQRNTSLQVRKFFYPRFKPRACGILSSESLQFSVKEEEKTESCFQPAGITKTLSNVASTIEVMQQTDSGNKCHGTPYQLSLRDITNCESPANFFPNGYKKDFFPTSCSATPYPINKNPSFRFLESTCLEKFPILSFASLEEQQLRDVALPSCTTPSPFSGKGESNLRSHKSEALLCSSTGDVLINFSNLAEPQLSGTVTCMAIYDKENHVAAVKPNSKAVLVYKSLKKTKRRRKLRTEQILSLRSAGDACTGILKTRSCTRLDMALHNRCVRAGPLLRSSQNGQRHGEKIIKERPLSTYRSKKFLVKTLLEKYLWNKRLKCGTPSRREVCLPFLNGEAGRRVECFFCKAFVARPDLTSCSHKDCNRSYHLTCGHGLEDFHFRKNGDAVCPQHVCMVCKRNSNLKVFRCERCPVAAHKKCFAFPENVIFLKSKPDQFICWRHPQDWRLESEYKAPTADTQEVFKRLPLPYAQAEFSIGSELPDEVSGNGLEPAPFVQIRRNIFLVKKKRDDFDDGVGCTCQNACRDNCECRSQSMSCSRSCTCNEKCGNKPFRKEKRIKLVKTLECGWGVQTTEAIVKGEFIIEYVGEVINESICEERLWTLKERGDYNFYMCEIGKDFIIDATFKGNTARFVNHSCEPNCNLEKWRVDGEIRVGIFAVRDIKDGEALTYDYRFIQFGPTVKCRCGASNCRGNLGESYQHKKAKLRPSSIDKIPAWGDKHRRSQRHQDSTLVETA
ncbi:hypothetical protein L7F22_002715 [Adiantum nelumboides]|nr:hypothetical protein [Adiantum nelumboides]